MLSAVVCGYAESLTGDEILALVRSSLPSEPLKLTGSLKVKAANGFTQANLPVEMQLDWGAPMPTASYRIDKETLTITWNNGVPAYAFSNPKNSPTSEILNSGITWADLSFSVFWWPNAKLISEERKINRECYVVDVPVPNSKKTMRLWIEQKMGMLLEAKTMNAKQQELSRLKIISIKKMDGMWVAKDLEISNQKTGTKTTLQISDLEWLNGPPVMEEPEEETEAAFDPAQSVNQLAVDLYKTLTADNDENLCFSPYSISTALAMTYAGARNKTAEQMNEVLHFGGPEITHPAFAYLRSTMDDIQKEGGIQLSIANALWPQKGYAFLPDFIALTKKFYDSEIHPVDYKTDTENARQQINAWVENQTINKITNLVGKGILDPLTRLVLVNAIYFKGDWANPFKPDATHPAPFYLANGSTNNVPMMTQKEQFSLAEQEGFTALKLPYDGDELSMIILLPKDVSGLEALQTNISADLLAGLEYSLQETQVYLPKFKLESSFELNKTMVEMGMPLAFSTDADFSGLDGTHALSIGEILHKTFIDMSEEGTEAAASTAVVMGFGSAAPIKTEEFIADHPFLFIIRENSTGTILFMGRVMDPSK